MPSTFQTLSINDTGFLQLPNGNVSNRPSNPIQAIIQWTNTGTQAVTTLSGSATTTSTTWTCPSGITSIEVLVVAGGGGGGGITSQRGGGGGAGGLIYHPNYSVVPGTVYSISVGQGGPGSTSSTQNSTIQNGNNSSFDTLIAIGGGGGGNYSDTLSHYSGAAGGSGGGGGGTNSISNISPGGTSTAGQGYNGGLGHHQYGRWSTGGGGGGAGGPGQDATETRGGLGGPGITLNITGSPVAYAGGGAGAGIGGYSTAVSYGGIGGGGNSGATGSAGVNGTGGGGGGGATSTGGAGGSGTVVIRYSLDSSNVDPRGQIRFNTITNTVEVFKSNNWTPKQQNSENIITDGLILNLDAANYLSGTTWYDSSNSGSNATIVGSPTWSPDYNGYFTLSSDKYFTTNLKNASGDWQHTVEVAFAPQSNQSLFTTGTRQNLFFIGTNAINQCASFEYEAAGAAGGLSTNYYFFSNDCTYTAKNIFFADTWTIITLVYSGGGGSRYNKRIFVNGVELPWDTQGSAALNIAANAFMSIGKDQVRNTSQFFGKLGYIRVYNRALSEYQVRHNVQQMANRYNINTSYQNEFVSTPIVKEGLVLCLDGAQSLHNTVTNRWSDLSGENDCRATTGYPGYTLIGQGSYDVTGGQTISSWGNPINSYPFTASIWAQSDFAWTLSSSMRELINFSIAGQRVSLGVSQELPGWNNGITIMYGGTNHWASYTLPSPTNGWNWHNLTFVVWGSNFPDHKFYLNGREVEMYNGGGGHGGSAGFTIASNATSGEYWDGRIGHIMLYNRGLSHLEVHTNYSALKHRYGII